jgi:hypothetical protein
MSPKDWYEPLVMPGILTVFGTLTYWLGWMSERNGKVAMWKWLGVIFLVVGMWAGFGYFEHMIGSGSDDVIYRAGMPSVRRYSYAHYMAFFLPLLALIGCVILHFVKKPTVSASPASEN